MAKNIPVIGWKNAYGVANSAYYSLAANVDTAWLFTTIGTDQNGKPVKARYVVIDNTGNRGLCFISLGVARFSVSPYTRKTFELNPDSINLMIEVFSGTIQVIFSDIDPGVPDETNQYASQGTDTPGVVTQSNWDPATFRETPSKPSYSGYSVIFDTGMSNSGSIHTVTGKTTAKYYVEISGNYIGSAQPINPFGICNDDYSYRLSCQQGNIVKVINNGAGVFQKTYTRGDNMRMAIDFTNKKAWIGKQGSNDWNGSNADPTVPSTGIDIADILATGTIYIFTGLAQTGNNPSPYVTLNSGWTPFNDFVPAGYTGGW